MALLTDYRFGHLVIDGVDEKRDVIILPDRVVRGWWRDEGHMLSLRDLRDVIDELPGHLIVGTGAVELMRLAPGVKNALEQRGVTVEVMSTADAVRRYGELDPEHAAAALHLTC